jgi:hypothetical protein
VSERRAIGLLLMLAGASAALGDEPKLSDPMRPLEHAASVAGSAPAERQIALTGILVAANRRVAVIDKRLYRVGDRINGDEIIRIEPGSIQIRRGTEAVQIALRGASATPVQTDGDQDQ